MRGYRKRESAAMRRKIFSPTADKVNMRNVRYRQPRGGRSA